MCFCKFLRFVSFFLSTMNGTDRFNQHVDTIGLDSW